MAASFPPSLAINDLSDDQITENVIYKEPRLFESSLKNTNNLHSVQHQSGSRTRTTHNAKYIQALLDEQSIRHPLADDIKTPTVWSIFNILWCCTCIGCFAC
jgi:hypothetical protein